MLTKEKPRTILQQKLKLAIKKVNAVLRGENVKSIEGVLRRIGRGKQLPHWYEGLKRDHVLPNLDGKTIGSVVEMILVGVLETYILKGTGAAPLRINPAKGVDLPDLDLGVKSPSKNGCTSEPFFSAYERLLGSDHDLLALLTDYQEAKKNPPLRLQIIDFRYLTKTKVADKNLCIIARRHRDWMLKDDISRTKRLVRFLAYVNQADWRASRLLKLVAHLDDENAVAASIQAAERDFQVKNNKNIKEDKIPIADDELAAIKGVLKTNPLKIGVIDALDNWIIETRKDSARAPNEDEWKRFLASPLDGIIGMSLALQWRYNFKGLFGMPQKVQNGESEGECEE